VIGDRLTDLRKDKKMTQEELGNILSVSSTTISGYETERNSPHDELKVRIAKDFNVSLDYLLGAIDDEIQLDRANVFIWPKGFSQDDISKVKDYVKLIVDSKK